MFLVLLGITVAIFALSLWNPLKLRGVIIKLILPWNEGFFIYPMDWGLDKRVNAIYFTWLCLHLRVILPLELPTTKAKPDPSVDTPVSSQDA